MSRTSEWMGLCGYQKVRTRLCRSSDPQSPRSFQDPAEGEGSPEGPHATKIENTRSVCESPGPSLPAEAAGSPTSHWFCSGLFCQAWLSGFAAFGRNSMSEGETAEMGTLTGRVDSRGRGQRNRKNSRYTDTKGVGSHGARARLHAGCSAETGLVPSESGSGHRSRSQAVSQTLTEFKVFAMTSMTSMTSDSKESASNAGDLGTISGEGEIPWRRE